MLHAPLRPSGLRPHQLDLLRRTLASDCSREEFDLFVETAEHYGLDPFRRQIMPLIIGKHQPATRRMIIIVGIDGQRLIAQRCGNYRPASEPAEIICSRRLKGPTNPLGIELARIRLFQQDNRGEWFPVVGEARWEEFAPIREEWAEDPQTQLREKTGTQFLDPKWARMPRLMIAKCANMQALRAGWPDQFGGIYAEEEMDRVEAAEMAASERLERARDENRRLAAAGKDTIAVNWGDWSLENLPLGEFAARVAAWIDLPGRQPAEVADWADTNKEALRLFWAASPAAALELKKLIEAGSRAPQRASEGGAEPARAVAR